MHGYYGPSARHNQGKNANGTDKHFSNFQVRTSALSVGVVYVHDSVNALYLFCLLIFRFDCKQCQCRRLVNHHATLELMIVQGRPSNVKDFVDCTKVGSCLLGGINLSI